MSPSTVVRRVLPAVELDRDQSAAVRYGRSLPEDVLDRAVMTPGEPMGAVAAGEGAGPHPDAVAGFAPDEDVVALLTRKGGRRARRVNREQDYPQWRSGTAPSRCQRL